MMSNCKCSCHSEHVIHHVLIKCNVCSPSCVMAACAAAEGPSWFVVLGAGGPDITSKSSFSAIYGESGISLPLTSASTSTILLILGQGRGLVLNSTLSDQVCVYVCVHVMCLMSTELMERSE